MKKLICIDLDGTILNMGETVDSQVRDYLKDMDDDYLICTGRPLHEVREFGFNGDCVASNGAEIVRDGQLVSEKKLDKQLVIDLVNHIRPHSQAVTISTATGRYMNIECDLESFARQIVIDYYHVFDQEHYQSVLNHLQQVEGFFDDVNEFVSNLDKSIMKIEATASNVNDQLVKRTNKLFDVNAFSSLGNHLEIVANGVNKARGIDEYLDGECRFIIAFGDGTNDIEMFNLANVSYAMENGNIELKKIATHVTDTIDNNGFLSGIEHFYNNYR